jgi:DNA mismatch repair protein MutL
VNSRLLAWAVEEAYHGLIMVGRHPVAVLNIAIPPQEVDVNIHPAKSEVKFRNERAVFAAVQRAVRRTIVSGMPVPSIEEPIATYSGPVLPVRETMKTAASQPALPLAVERARPLAGVLPVLRVLGQVLSSYIVAEGPDGVYLIDQHAAHERVLFERLRRKRDGRETDVQGLLEPVSLEFTPRQEEALRASAGALSDFGFSLEPFGERTYLVRAVPVVLRDDEWQAALREVLDSLYGEGETGRDEKILASLACHGAVRAGQSMSDGEMRSLVREMEQLENPQTCPHGRPTVIRLGREKLERDFGRG